MTTALTLPERAALALNSAEHRKKLAGLVQQSSSIKEVLNKDGREEAHRAAMTLKSTRTSIKATGKAAREDATAFSNAVIAEEKELIKMIEPEENRLFSLRDEWDAKIEAERQAKIQAERDRISAIQECIEKIRSYPVRFAGKSSKTISEGISALVGHEITDEFQEFKDQAKALRLEILDQLAAMETEQIAVEVAAEAARQEAERQRISQEAEAARLKAEREELEVLRAEQAKRDAEARAEIMRQQAELAEKAAEAERKAQAEIDERNRLAAIEQKRLDDEREALEAEKRKFQEQQQAEERAAEVKRQAELQAAAEAEQAAKEKLKPAPVSPSPEYLVEVVAAHFNVSFSQSLTWLATADFQSLIEEVA